MHYVRKYWWAIAIVVFLVPLVTDSAGTGTRISIAAKIFRKFGSNLAG